MIVECNLGPGIFLVPILGNGGCQLFHILHTCGTSPFHQNDWIMIGLYIHGEWLTIIHVQVSIIEN